MQKDRIDPLRLELRYWRKNMNYQHTNDWFKDIFPSMAFHIKPEIKLGGEGVTD